MGKILEFKGKNSVVTNGRAMNVQADESEDAIGAILNNTSLTVANRHWLLENLLMDMDDQLESYRKELELAELKLDTLVTTAEREISAAYLEYDAQLAAMTHAVKKLTVISSPETTQQQVPDRPSESPDQQTTLR